MATTERLEPFLYQRTTSTFRGFFPASLKWGKSHPLIRAFHSKYGYRVKITFIALLALSFYLPLLNSVIMQFLVLLPRENHCRLSSACQYAKAVKPHFSQRQKTRYFNHSSEGAPCRCPLVFTSRAAACSSGTVSTV